MPQEFLECHSIAKRFADGGLSDRDSWAKALVEDRQGNKRFENNLRPLILMILGFLGSETACERSFAHERKQRDHRPKLNPETRRDGLKIIEDGLELKRLHEGGTPTSDFFAKVQEHYASKFGSRVLRSLTMRCDSGIPRKRRLRTDGKQTITDFKRRRTQSLATPVPFGPGALTVFEYPAPTRTRLEELRDAETTKAPGSV